MRKSTTLVSSGNLERYFELMDDCPKLFGKDDEQDALSLVLDRDTLLKQQQAQIALGALVGRPPHYYTLGVLAEDELQIFLRDLVRYPSGLLLPSERHVYKSKVYDEPFVVIVPYSDGKILLTRRFARLYRRWEWFVPTFSLHENVGFFEQASEKILETTGYQPAKITPLFRMYADNTPVFIADVTNHDAGKAGNLSGTVGESRWFSMPELEMGILNGSVTDYPITAAYIHIVRYGFTSVVTPDAD